MQDMLFFSYIYTDIDECAENVGICGIGNHTTVCENLVGDFYSCKCPEGSITNNGNASTLGLTCIGMHKVL